MSNATPAPLPPIAPAPPVAISGWHVTDGYAQPAVAGGGYVEMSDAGVLEVGYETDQSARDMGLDAFLTTKVPVEVLRALVNAYDAEHALLTPRPTLTAEERHQALDVTFARYLMAHPGGTLPSEVSVLDLARWHAGEMGEGRGDLTATVNAVLDSADEVA